MENGQKPVKMSYMSQNAPKGNENEPKLAQNRRVFLKENDQ